MKRNVGLWIDQHKTVMITMENEKEETREIRSNVEKHVRLTGTLHPSEHKISAVSTTEDVNERGYGNHLLGYYDGVVSMLRNADSIWIFGPGEAKVELKKRLESADLGGRIERVDTVTKMTDRQIATKVRLHFQG
jgi:hypothetical protein